jgi:hypothetical protein
MPKLKDGEKVVQQFNVVIKFKSSDGDEKYKVSHIRDILVGSFVSDYGPEHGIKTIIKEVKEPAI